QQDQKLINQLVQAANEMQEHVDPAYLQNNTARLNGWLREQPAVEDFHPLDRVASRKEQLGALALLASNIDSSIQAFLTAEQPTQEDGQALVSLLNDFSQQCRPLSELFRARSLVLSCQTAEALKNALDGASEFQFMDRGHLMQDALKKYEFPADFSFAAVASGLTELSVLCRLDGREFRPSDAYHLEESVWMRSATNWIIAGCRDDTEIALRLFDWSCRLVALRAADVTGPKGEIRQMPWQTLIIGQGTAIERAVVFMGLLRQYRIDSFLVRPTAVSAEQNPAFPLVVAVVINNSTALFLPELGLPIPAGGALELPGEGEDRSIRITKVASLDDVAADDSLLRRLDLSQEAPLPLKAEDFASVKALVPAGPFELSERMRILEPVFNSEQYMDATVLAVSYDQLAERLGGISRVSAVEPALDLWAPMIDQLLFPEESQLLMEPYLRTIEAGADLSIENDTKDKESAPDGTSTGSDFTSVLHQNEVTYAPLWGGKILFLAGNMVGENSAAYWFQQGKIPDRLLKQTLSQLPQNVSMVVAQAAQEASQRGEQLSEDNMRTLAALYTLQQWKEVSFQEFFRSSIRFDQALVAVSEGNLSTAREHLKNQLEDLSLFSQLLDVADRLQLQCSRLPNGQELFAMAQVPGQLAMIQMWQGPSSLLLGQIREREGQYEEAIELYNKVAVPLAYGARVRGNWLASLAGIERKIEEQPAAEDRPAETPAGESAAEDQPAEAPADEPAAEDQPAEAPAA
ncbi:MAG: hypothetical protein J6S75_10365, partial [Thermoguttaceae bacterium]|nr:hypothetical protein [Thermoguttaceae bacterium]